MSTGEFLITRPINNVLVPASREDLDFLCRYTPGAELKTTLSQPRSLKHHNLYWAVLRRVVDMTGGAVWPNSKALDYAIKVQLRMFGEGIRLFDGEVRFEVQSISFGSMDQAGFKVFFDQAMQAIAESTAIDMVRVIDDVKRNIGWTAANERAFSHAKGQ
jgi:hypothetical protein